jgi:thiol-disulfide isomerase/thioredoxin
MNQPAPELTGSPWLNSPVPVKLAARRGQVTIVHFWTFACINCKRNLPIYNRWHRDFSPRGVAVIGVHTPELDFERDPNNVRQKLPELGIEYPVLLDADFANWRRWHQQFWPTVYLIGKDGRLRARWEGEMNFRSIPGEARMTEWIERLLGEAA